MSLLFSSNLSEENISFFRSYRYISGRHKLSKTSPESWGNGLHFKCMNISLKMQRTTLMLGSVASVWAFSTQKIQNNVRIFNLIPQCSLLFFLTECCPFMEANSIVPKNYNVGNMNLSLMWKIWNCINLTSWLFILLLFLIGAGP